MRKRKVEEVPSDGPQLADADAAAWETAEIAGDCFVFMVSWPRGGDFTAAQSMERRR
jgi:hypothetical protein